jgi:hypothetical protein
MAQSITKNILSASTDGRGIPVAATSTPGTTIHTGPSTATHFDEIWLYAVNTSSADKKLTVEWGGTATGDQIEVTIPGESGLVLVVPGLLIKGNDPPLVVKAFAESASAINSHGYVNEIV